MRDIPWWLPTLAGAAVSGLLWTLFLLFLYANS